MKDIDIRKVIERLVEENKIAVANEDSAKILADNLPKNTILHFAGETPFVIDEATNSIFFFNGDMEDWYYNNFDPAVLERTTREHLEYECLVSLQAYAWRNAVRGKLPQINAVVFDKDK